VHFQNEESVEFIKLNKETKEILTVYFRQKTSKSLQLYSHNNSVLV
jgi:hypothetical protein